MEYQLRERVREVIELQAKVDSLEAVNNTRWRLFSASAAVLPCVVPLHGLSGVGAVSC